VTWTLKRKENTFAYQEAHLTPLLRKIFAMARHPNHSKRLGACIAFNKIYRPLREEKLVRAKYTLEIISVLLECLGLAEKDRPELGTREETRKAIANYQDIVERDAEKDNCFISHGDRSGPAFCQSLYLFVEHCFHRTGLVADLSRRHHMQLFASFSALLPASSDEKAAKSSSRTKATPKQRASAAVSASSAKKDAKAWVAEFIKTSPQGLSVGFQFLFLILFP